MLIFIFLTTQKINKPKILKINQIVLIIEAKEGQDKEDKITTEETNNL